jgi:excisionase family DNA binding protein
MRAERAAWTGSEHPGGSGTDDRGHALPQLLTLTEVATLLKLNERTIRRMISTRRLPCVRIGRQLRFDPEALSRWLQAREEG